MPKFHPATLALADGTLFYGQSFGAQKTCTAEVVFNTSLTGYQEILTDPSYHGQFVVMTMPHIGNTGVNPDDMEADNPWVAGFFVREISRMVSNFRATESLPDFLTRHDVPGMTGVNTRALVRHLREKGAMMAAFSAAAALKPADLVAMAQSATPMGGRNLAAEVTCAAPYRWDTPEIAGWETLPHVQRRWRVVAFDFGIKRTILRMLAQSGCDVTVVPAHTSAADVLGLHPDGIFLSNGPGDPAAVSPAIETVQILADTGIPIFGICLGHQILALALGGKTHKMKFGHRGSNQPVQTGGTGGAVSITSHNHGFAVTAGSLPEAVEVTRINLNDGCVEGLRHREKPLFSVQYHPEASPGTHDAVNLFGEFTALMAQKSDLQKR